MALPPVQFDSLTHTYTASGRWLPGATRILSDMGYNKGSSFYTEQSRKRGHAVHLACELADRHAPNAKGLGDVLDVLDLDERLHPDVTGYLLFRRETGFKPIHHELTVWSKRLGVAGMLDKWGEWGDGKRALVDLKSWRSQGVKPKRSAELQTAGYGILAKESMGLETDLRVVVKLPGDGKYRMYECSNPQDAMLFTYCASVWWDRKNAGLLEDPGGPSEVEVEA